MSRYEITINGNYLVLPIGLNVDTRKVVFFVDDEMVMDLDLRLDYINPQYFVYYDVKAFRGKKMELEIHPQMAFREQYADEPASASNNRYRPQFHFTAPFGWINDPNGLLAYTSPVTGKTTYHIFYQHNPYDVIWGNMHWGHAVSTDLIKWEHRPIALYPDKLGNIFSGCAIVDKENRSGLKEGNEDVIILFYTAAGGTNRLSEGQPFTQCIAYSTDGGETFKKYKNNPIIPNICGENRDPKVIWCDELSCYIMALYLIDSTFALLISNDLLNWKMLQEIVIDGDAECPDLFPLNLNGNQKKRYWILSGASHLYVVGEFQNGRFNIIQGPRPLNYENFSYAGQTFSDVPDGRRIQISWERFLNVPDACFNGQMSVPTELSLVSYEDEYRLCAKPVKELISYYGLRTEFNNIEISPESSYSIDLEAMPCEISLDLSNSYASGQLSLLIFGKKIQIDYDKNTIRLGDNVCPLHTSGHIGRLTMLIDTCSMELFSDNGTIMMTTPFLCDFNLSVLSINSNLQREISSLSFCHIKLD